jgi:hypothetical protein
VASVDTFFSDGGVSQLVERRTDSPCVAGSTPAVSIPCLRLDDGRCNLHTGIRQMRVRAENQHLAQWVFAE